MIRVLDGATVTRREREQAKHRILTLQKFIHGQKASPQPEEDRIRYRKSRFGEWQPESFPLQVASEDSLFIEVQK